MRATQVSISRDAEELGLLKVAGRYQAAPAGAGHSDPELPLRTWVRGASAAGPHLVVIRCDAGTAQGVARALDYAGMEGLVGTVAGDDTVFAAVDSARSAAALLGRIKDRISPDAARAAGCYHHLIPSDSLARCPSPNGVKV